MVGVLTFWLHHKLPYRRMLVLTGVLVGFVLVVMIGGTALSFQELGWLPRHATPFGAGVDGRVVRDVLDLGDARRPAAGGGVRGRLLLRGRVRQGQRPQRRGEEPAGRAQEAPAVRSDGSPLLPI